jgi:uncharacterized membrane protein YccC
MTRHLRLRAAPYPPVWSLVATGVAISVALTTVFVLAGVPDTLLWTVGRTIFGVGVTVAVTLWRWHRWKRKHPPLDGGDVLANMLRAYLKANREAAPWN